MILAQRLAIGFKVFVLFLLATFFLGEALAAIPSSIPSSSDSGSLRQTLKSLKLRENQGMQVVLRQGYAGYRNLLEIAFDEEKTMQTRWRALNRMAKLGGKKSINELEKAARSHEWFMRDASLVAMENVAPEKSIEWARKLVADPSLVVRTSAVTTIKKAKDWSSRELLWKELNNKINFRKGKSLWLRRMIVETLAEIAHKDDTERFIQTLNDKDVSLHPSAMTALEKINNQKFKVSDPGQRAQLWKAWWFERSPETTL